MTHETIAHDTVTLERRYAAPPQRVFGAWADPEAVRRWGAPSEDVTLRHEATDFRAGGGA